MSTTASGENEAWVKNKPQAKDNGDVPPMKYNQGKGIFGRRTTLEKILIGVLAPVLIILVIVVVILIVSSSPDKKDDPPGPGQSANVTTPIKSAVKSPFALPDYVTYQDLEICITKDCINAASRIDRNIDYSVSPCDDLYQFACGGWMKKNAIPEDLQSYSKFGILIKQVDVVLRNLLQEEHKPNDLECMKKAKDLYASCLETDTIEERGDQVLKDMLLQELGGWPLTDKTWDPNKFDMVDTLIKLNKVGEYPIIFFYVGLDSKDSSRRVLTMDQPRFGMPGQKYYQVPRDDKMLKAYEELIAGVATLLGLANPVSAAQDISDIVEFEMLLANISVPDEQRRDSNDLYNPMTLEEVHRDYSTVFDWKRYVMTLLQLPGVQVLDVTQDERIVNRAPLYFDRLTDVILKTPKRTVANYMIWGAVQNLISTQGEEYAELLRKYRKVLFGISAEMARFRLCAGYATSNLDQCVGRMFIKDNFQVEAKVTVLDMIKELHKSFNELLDDLEWMDDKTRKMAKEKNDFISPKIGYPEQVMNDTYLEERYSIFTYYRDKYFENVLENKRQAVSKNLRELRQPFDKKKWEGDPSQVNAYYNPVKNQIMFPAGILQPPFFSMTYPKSMNFGGIGFLIGHEVTHGFDDKGRQYDKYGNLVQWWAKEAEMKFKKKAQCVIDQYGNFSVPGIDMNLNGVNTQGENIADNGGLKQAFKAYRNWVDRRGKEEPLLPGLGFTHNQIFFINFAQMWCVLSRDAALIGSIRTGVHSPGKFRVIGSAQNSPDFAKAFNCPSGTYMNPKKKCTVW
ncbi:hypothetical protein RRG08_053831 [Elysia crispata]|uniref:Neprilysin n=1 Tax=Elysia crispata TaxID=231223 RepID=A0AAE1AC75_9GAST|nr:hypothetical protein RRG08_053831 [Elysia crispata]